jgi:hypothetical protein
MSMNYNSKALSSRSILSAVNLTSRVPGATLFVKDGSKSHTAMPLDYIGAD